MDRMPVYLSKGTVVKFVNIAKDAKLGTSIKVLDQDGTIRTFSEDSFEKLVTAMEQWLEVDHLQSDNTDQAILTDEQIDEFTRQYHEILKSKQRTQQLRHGQNRTTILTDEQIKDIASLFVVSEDGLTHGVALIRDYIRTSASRTT
jgi:hypothetical protein